MAHRVETYLRSSTFSKAQEDSCVHLLPCTIDYDGEAKVDNYFDSVVSPKDPVSSDVVYQSSFRGRPLKGKKVQVPAGFIGAFVTEEKEAITDEEERNLMAFASFKELTYWNLENQPSINDNIIQAMEWYNIAKVLHSNIEDETQPSQPTER